MSCEWDCWGNSVPLWGVLGIRRKRASEMDKALNAWEEDRLLASGVVRRKEVGSEGSFWFIVFRGEHDVRWVGSWSE